MRREFLNETCIPNYSVLILIDLLREKGLDPSGVLKRCGLSQDAIQDTKLMVTGSQELHVQRAFSQIAGDDVSLFVEAGRRYRVLCYRPWGLALMTAPTFGALLDVNDRFTDLNYTLSRFRRIEAANGDIGILLDFSDVPADLKRFMQCRDAVAFTTFLHDIWYGEFPFSSIELPLPLADYAGFDFKTAHVSSTGRAAWFWAPDIMARSLPCSDRTLHNSSLRESELLLAKTKNTLLAKVEFLLARQECLGMSLPTIARHLNVSERTLQRELAVRDVSFRFLLDKARQHLAERMLTQTTQPVADIADALGYANTPSFYQAFRRWTGYSPGSFRSVNRRSFSSEPYCGADEGSAAGRMSRAIQ